MHTDWVIQLHQGPTVRIHRIEPINRRSAISILRTLVGDIRKFRFTLKGY